MKQTEGLITDCSNSGCVTTLGANRCCDFQQGNYIVLYPGEYEEAVASGISVAHLPVVDENYHGGKKVLCAAKNTAICDGGLKPFDCAVYPYFPADPDGDMMIKGKKCPLQPIHLAAHAAVVRTMTRELIDRNPAVAGWLSKIEMVGYTEPQRPISIKDGVIEVKAVAA